MKDPGDGRSRFALWLKSDVAADLNEDGTTNFKDFLVHANRPPTTATAPEDGLVEELIRPGLFIADTAASAAFLIEGLHDPSLRERIAAVDFAHNLFVVAFRGQMKTGGFAIHIADIRAESGTLQVEVDLVDQDADGFAAQFISFPYDAVEVSRVDFSSEEVKAWTMLTLDGEPLARTRYPDETTSSGGNISGDTPVIVTDPRPIDPAAEQPVLAADVPQDDDGTRRPLYLNALGSRLIDQAKFDHERLATADLPGHR